MKSEGEYFSSRGVGFDQIPGCFICGGTRSLLYGISSYSPDMAAAERVVAMFQHGACIAHSESMPDKVLVRIGACLSHRSRVDRLERLTRGGSVITLKMILSCFDTGMS